MLFNFRLFPFSELMSEISHREHPDEYQRRVSWFDQTEGWYWIDVGKTHLFRYTQQANEQFHSPRPANGLYVDDHVTRLWEDVLEILPAILEPLPAVLVERLSSLSDWNDWLADRDDWNDARNNENDEEEFDEDGIEFLLAATQWSHDRQLNTGPLVAGPRIWFW